VECFAEPNEQICPFGIGSAERRRVVDCPAVPVGGLALCQIGGGEVAGVRRPTQSVRDQTTEFTVSGKLADHRRCRRILALAQGAGCSLMESHALQRMQFVVRCAGDEAVCETEGARRRSDLDEQPRCDCVVEHGRHRSFTEVEDVDQHLAAELEAEDGSRRKRRWATGAERSHSTPQHVAQTRWNRSGDRSTGETERVGVLVEQIRFDPVLQQMGRIQRVPAGFVAKAFRHDSSLAWARGRHRSHEIGEFDRIEAG